MLGTKTLIGKLILLQESLRISASVIKEILSKHVSVPTIKASPSPITENPTFKEEDILEITQRIHGHNFSIGEKVRVVANNGGSYKCISLDNSKEWSITSKEAKLVSMAVNTEIPEPLVDRISLSSTYEEMAKASLGVPSRYFGGVAPYGLDVETIVRPHDHRVERCWAEDFRVRDSRREKPSAFISDPLLDESKEGLVFKEKKDSPFVKIKRLLHLTKEEPLPIVSRIPKPIEVISNPLEIKKGLIVPLEPIKRRIIK